MKIMRLPEVLDLYKNWYWKGHKKAGFYIRQYVEEKEIRLLYINDEREDGNVEISFSSQESPDMIITKEQEEGRKIIGYRSQFDLPPNIRKFLNDHNMDTLL